MVCDPGATGGLVTVAVTGKVRVTVVGVVAHCVQTVTVVVQPSGGLGAVVCPTDPGGRLVTVAVAGTVPGQYVVV